MKNNILIYNSKFKNRENMLNILKLAVLILLFFISYRVSFSYAQSPDKHIVMVSMLPENSYNGKWIKRIYIEAFRRLGLNMDYKYFPAKRASLISSRGTVDGDLFRAYKYGNFHPELIRVDESIYTTKVSAFAVNSLISLDGWDSLKGTNYRVEYRIGVKLSENALPNVVDKKNLSAISHWTNAFKKLVKGRTDIYIDVEDVILRALENESSGNFKSIQKVGVMEIAPVHAYLHKRHKELDPKLSSVLKQMKQEGVVEEYYRQLTY